VLIRGKHTPFISGIGTDQLTVDANSIPEVRENDEVVLIVGD